MDETKAARRQARYIRRHQESSHDTAAWLMLCLYWARWYHHRIGREMPPPPHYPLSFQDPRQRTLFRLAGAITPDQVGILRPEYSAICRILNARATRAGFAQADLDQVAQTLNYPVYLRASGEDRRPIDDDKSTERLTAELLLRYLDSLVWSHVPESIAACVSCGGLFLRIKANQTACSDACRMESLKRAGYWDPKERRTRRQRRQRAAAHRSKTVGKTEGELSEKKRENAGKSKTKR